MSKKDEALKLALEALEYNGLLKRKQAITAIREALAEPVEWLTGCPECGMDGGCDCDSGTWNPPAQQEPVSTIRALTNQCAALIQERDELQKQVWRYEKNGVTCQTYQHKIDRTCSECNVQEDYTSPPARKPEDK